MGREELRIRDSNTNLWKNILNTNNIQLVNSKNYFSSSYVEDALIELFERFMLPVVNKEEVSIYKGQPVFITGNDEVYLGSASDLVKYNVAGFVYTDQILPNGIGLIKTEGIITNTIENWNNIISDNPSNGLEEGVNYFLSLIDGKITSVAPEDPETFLVPIGKALTKNHFKIDIDPAIGL